MNEDADVMEYFPKKLTKQERIKEAKKNNIPINV
mgnify:CR=1 FL=1